MFSIIERQRDILGFIQSLDISPSMYKNAVEKYHALAKHLESYGIEAEIYPQGSFALGTVVRPSVDDSNANYDLDFICQVRERKSSTSPSELRSKILKALISNAIYSDRLSYDENCFTITYADINNIGFAIDVVPAVDEDIITKYRLECESERPDLINTAIAIPRCSQEKQYRWITSNPKGIRAWFDEINRPFALYNREQRRQIMYRDNRSVFASVEDIPEALERSSLQRIIQIMKRHRDVYYTNLHRSDYEELKPASVIITAIVARIAKSADSHMSVFDLLEYVLHELSVYSNRLVLNEYAFAHTYGTRTVINQINGKWMIPNPSNPEDNLADRWNSNKEIPKCFFRWIDVCIHDLISSMSLSDSEFRTNMENAFGSAAIQNKWSDKYKCSTLIDPAPIKTTAKPYRV